MCWNRCLQIFARSQIADASSRKRGSSVFWDRCDLVLCVAPTTASLLPAQFRGTLKVQPLSLSNFSSITLRLLFSFLTRVLFENGAWSETCYSMLTARPSVPAIRRCEDHCGTAGILPPLQRLSFEADKRTLGGSMARPVLRMDTAM